MRYLALIVAMVFAGADWLAVARGRKDLEYVFKPATMVAILSGAWLWARGPEYAWQARFFVPGFAFSLVGDVLLMLRSRRLFLGGLVAFLLAHVCYTIGLNATVPPGSAFVVLIPVGGIGVVLFRGLVQGLREKGEDRMVVPVGAYGVTLSLLLFSAWTTLFRPAWSGRRAWLVAIGASLFFVSDALLAWDRFVQTVPRGRLWVHMTYHAAQLALAASMLLAR